MKVNCSNILVTVACVVIFGTLTGLLNYHLSRPIAQVSNTTEKVVSVQLNDGTFLKPGDKGFDETVAKATYEWVQ